MDTWSTILGQRTMESICSMAHDVGKISDNQPTLRDMFAMSALQGLLSSQNSCGNHEEFATWAYEYADEMLKAREVKNDTHN